MEVLFAVIPDESMLEPILEQFHAAGIRGATVFDTVGMGHILYDSIPLLARLRETSASSTTHNRTIMTVIDPAQRQDAVEAVERICGDLDEPNSGVIFSIPVLFHRGTKKKTQD